jgi:hypothetical protein
MGIPPGTYAKSSEDEGKTRRLKRKETRRIQYAGSGSVPCWGCGQKDYKPKERTNTSAERFF